MHTRDIDYNSLMEGGNHKKQILTLIGLSMKSACLHKSADSFIDLEVLYKNSTVVLFGEFLTNSTKLELNKKTTNWIKVQP